jgi:predicted nucleotidyltransferase
MLPEVEQTLEDALSITDTLGLRVLLVGAWARDLCLPEATRSPPRKTNDADLAVLVDDWRAMDALFDASHARFELQRAELTMRHRHHGVKVDVIPCGGIETPRGELHLRNSPRVFNTIGLADAFSSARTHPIGSRTVLIPQPHAYTVLKLLSFLDRRAPRDLRDLGYVVVRNPYDPDTIWDEPATRNALADGTLQFDDLPVWFVGRNLKATFDADVVASFTAGLTVLAAQSMWHRGLLFHHVADTDERLRRADRLIRVLRLACS